MSRVKEFGRPAFRTYYEVAGRLLLVQSSNEVLGKTITQLFNAWLFLESACAARPPDVVVTFRCNERLPEIPSGLERFEIAGGGRCYKNGSHYYADLDICLMSVSEGEAAVEVDLWMKRMPELRDVWLARAASFGICTALRRRALFELHGAGLLDPEGRCGVLVIGPSGSGKSTLTIQLVKEGWRYLSDDELLLRMVDDQVEARGFRSFFALRRRTLELGVEVEALVAAETEGGSGRVCFEPDAFFSGRRVETVLPRRLFFIRVDGKARTFVKSISRAASMANLVRACPWATYDTEIARENLGVLAALARQSKSFELAAGTDLLDSNRASELLMSYIRD